MKITLSIAKVCGKPSNRYYPDTVVIKDAGHMAAAAAYDHVCGSFKDGRRSRENFLNADCIVMDCDNGHSEDPEDWVSMEDILSTGVACIIVPSRNNMKEKGSNKARPRYHVYFPVEEITDEAAYTALKRRIHDAFPVFDGNALDSARFIFGNNGLEATDIVWNDSTLSIQEYLFLMGDTDDTIMEGNRNSALSVFAGRMLKKYGNTKEAHDAFKAEAEKCVPPLDNSELRSIWRSALHFYRTKVSKEPGYVKPEEYNGPEWTDPIPFDKPNTDPFPVDALPPVLSEYVAAVAESTQTPVDMAGTVVISILSACLQGKYKIQCKADWIEPLNTYALVIAAPSERKSAVTNMMVRPLHEYEIRYNRDHAAEVERSHMTGKMLERRQKVVIEEYAKGKAEEGDIQRIAEQIAEFQEVEPLRMYVDDITPEKLVSILAANKGHIAMISTEGGIFDTLAGTYSKVVNIDVMLKGYSGDTIRVDRIGRESEYVTDPALTILLMAQPNVVSAVLSNSTFRGRGLTARFLYCLPVSCVGKRRYHSKPVDPEIVTKYEEKIRNLLEDESQNELITLSPEADRLITAYAEELEPLLVTKYMDLADWCGKLVGNTMRIAGLLCRAEVTRLFDFLDVNEPLVVSEAVMNNAIRLSRYYLSHAQAVYSVMPAGNADREAEKILNVIREKKLTVFDRREMMRWCRSFKTVTDIQPVLDSLEDYGYIARKAEKTLNTGRPPLPTYLVNPILSCIPCQPSEAVTTMK